MDTEEALFEMLDKGQIDLIEYFDAPPVRKPGRSYQPVLEEGRYCLMAMNHPLASRTSLTVEDLLPYQICVYRFDRVPGFKEYMEEKYPAANLSEHA